MQNNAVNSKLLNWNNTKKTAYEQAINLNTPYEMGNVMRNILKSLNDYHGSVFYRDSTFKWPGKVIETTDSMKAEWKKGVKIKTKILTDKIGYLRIPSMSTSTKTASDSVAQTLNDSLSTLLKHNIKGIVLDLRLNGGGSMVPMILGVSQLIQPGKIGSFIDQTNQDWIIKDNQFYFGTEVQAAITPKFMVNAVNIPVVILTSPVTGSSAEFFIIAFKGRKNTVLLGSNTAGYTTAVKGIKIDDSSYIYLSTGYAKDRNGKEYKDDIKADIPLAAVDEFNNITADSKVNAAIKWLRSHTK
ncbi:MAG: S41 family peptidase [Mucilaginibacter sp.]